MTTKKFFATFMQKQAFKSHYVEIWAKDIGLARDAMFEHFGDKFMTIYNEEQFKTQPIDYNLEKLCVINAIDHESSKEYQLLAVGNAPMYGGGGSGSTMRGV